MYRCPRCNNIVHRCSSDVMSSGGGPLFELLAYGLGKFHCPACGDISKTEFPWETRRKIYAVSCIFVAIVLAVFMAVIFGL